MINTLNMKNYGSEPFFIDQNFYSEGHIVKYLALRLK